MPKLLILQQLQQIKDFVVHSFNEQDAKRLSIREHLSLLMERTDIDDLDNEDTSKLVNLLRRLFPEWTIQPLAPERVNIAYVLRVLDVARSTFYRSIDKKLLKRSGMIGGRPVYLKSEVDWLGTEAQRLGNGGWVYSKLWEQKKSSGDP